MREQSGGQGQKTVMKETGCMFKTYSKNKEQDRRYKKKERLQDPNAKYLS